MKTFLTMLLAASLSIFGLTGCGTTVTSTAETGTEHDHLVQDVQPSLTDKPEATDQASQVFQESINARETIHYASGGEDEGLFANIIRLSRLETDVVDGHEVPIADVWYDVALLGDSQNTKYPRLAATMEAERIQYAQRMDEQIQSLLDAVKENPNTAIGHDGYHYYIQSEMTMRHMDDSAASLLRYTNCYTGGAHGNYWYECYNYDPDTGEALRLSDQVADDALLMNCLREQLICKYGADYLIFMDHTFEDMKLEQLVWTLEPDGIAFWFEPYSLNSFADGSQCVTLTYAKYPQLFTKQ